MYFSITPDRTVAPRLIDCRVDFNSHSLKYNIHHALCNIKDGEVPGKSLWHIRTEHPIQETPTMDINVLLEEIT